MGTSAAPSLVPSVGRTILHGTSQLFLEGWFSFIRNPESTYPDLFKSVSRATSPGESLGDLPFLFCQPTALTLVSTLVSEGEAGREHLGASSLCLRGAQVQSLGGEDALEKGMATLSSILACRIPWTEEHGELQSMESQRVRHN